MLFKGVKQEDIIEWPMARTNAASGVEWWKDVVGVDVERASDVSLFRVLEWGGMEVLLK
jgi:hypothetical protein